MKKNVLFAPLVVVLLALGAPAFAHHSANAEFDTTKELKITGTLTKVENVNPHSWWYVDVMGPDGKVTSWKLESLAPAGLIRQGLKLKTNVQIPGTYEFRISPAWKDPDANTKLGFMKAIIVDGKEYVVVEL